MRITYCDRCGKKTESPIRTLCKKCWTELEEELHYPKTPYITNADRIRAMTDEELAEMLSKPFPYNCARQKCTFMWKSCKDCALNWLQQEATDEKPM